MNLQILPTNSEPGLRHSGKGPNLPTRSGPRLLRGSFPLTPQQLKGNRCVCVLVAQPCSTAWDRMDCSPFHCSPWNSPGKNTGAGSHFLLQGNGPKPEMEFESPALQADSKPPGKPRREERHVPRCSHWDWLRTISSGLCNHRPSTHAQAHLLLPEEPSAYMRHGGTRAMDSAWTSELQQNIRVSFPHQAWVPSSIKWRQLESVISSGLSQFWHFLREEGSVGPWSRYTLKQTSSGPRSAGHSHTRSKRRSQQTWPTSEQGSTALHGLDK